MKMGRPGYKIPENGLHQRTPTYCQGAAGNISLTSDELIHFLPGVVGI
jgi:hypothetical protein